MSVDITIGETISVTDADEGSIRVPRVLKRTVRDGPQFPQENILDRRSNHRAIATHIWGDFLNEVGLWDLFEGHGGLAAEAGDDGAVALTVEHHQAVVSALGRYRIAHRQAVPQYETTDEDAALARLIWLEWWMAWALAHCEHPAIYVN